MKNRNNNFYLSKISRSNNKKGQVWVETVIYTLIAFTMIGLVLTFARPKIEETRDKAVIEQSLEVLDSLDNTILSLEQGGPGNKRVIDLAVRDGKFEIDGQNDRIVFELEGNYRYSEPGKKVSSGGVTAYTEERGKSLVVNFTLDYYGEYNLTFDSADELRVLNKAPSPYRLIITYNSMNPTANIDFSLNN